MTQRDDRFITAGVLVVAVRVVVVGHMRYVGGGGCRCCAHAYLFCSSFGNASSSLSLISSGAFRPRIAPPYAIL